MENQMKKIIHLVILLLIINFMPISQSLAQQEFELTVHHAPGGPSDTVARIISQHLPANYIVVNRPGALGTIAVNQVLRSTSARPSILVATMPQIFVTNPLMVPNINHNPERDLETIAVIGVLPNVLVCNNRHNFRSIDDLKRVSTSLNFGIGSIGSNEHLATALLLKQWDNSHQIVAYPQGGVRALPDLINGSIDCMFANYPLVRGSLNGQHYTALMSSVDLNLNIPTWQQTFNSSYPFESYIGLVVSRTLENEIKNQIRENITRSFAQANLRQQIENIGLFSVLSTDQLHIDNAIMLHDEIRKFLAKNQINLN